MRAEGAYTTLEDLKEWYDLNQQGESKYPYFTIYRGSQAKTDSVIFRNKDESDPEKAWEGLEMLLDRQTKFGGEFRIYITDKPGHNYGFHALLKVNNPYSNTPGIGNANAGLYGIFGSPQEAIESEVKRRTELYELRREVEDMRNEKAGQIGMMDQFFSELIQRPEIYQLIQAAGFKFLGAMQAKNQGQPTAPPPGGTHMPDMSHVGDDEGGFDYDRVEPALEQMREVFPDTEGTIEKLAAWVKKNPDQARTVIDNL